MLSIKGFFSVASPASFFPFVPVCSSSVSDPCPYPSCLCLPLYTSFSCCPSSSRREGAAASSVLSLPTFMSIPACPTNTYKENLPDILILSQIPWPARARLPGRPEVARAGGHRRLPAETDKQANLLTFKYSISFSLSSQDESMKISYFLFVGLILNIEC